MLKTTRNETGVSQSPDVARIDEQFAEIAYRELSILADVSELSFATLLEMRFRFRGALGRELRRMVCYFPKRRCDQCSLVDTCAYGVLFHSDAGEAREVHPWLLAVRPHTTDDRYLWISIRLFGSYIEYVPFVYYSVVRASQKGVARRVGFGIERVLVDRCHTESDDEQLTLPHETSRLKLSLETARPTTHELVFRTRAPVRVKGKGKYLGSLNMQELWIAAARRAERMVRLYGSGMPAQSQIAWQHPPAAERECAEFEWLEAPYRSRPQATTLRLGGVVGELRATVVLTHFQRDVLNSVNVLHLGKNTTFGLGDARVELGALSNIQS